MVEQAGASIAEPVAREEIGMVDIDDAGVNIRGGNLAIDGSA